MAIKMIDDMIECRLVYDRVWGRLGYILVVKRVYKNISRLSRH